MGTPASQPSGDGAEGRLLEFLRERYGSGALDMAVAPLSGDASTRRYYRLLHGSGTSVLALYPEPFKMGELSFAVVAALLASWGLRVPAILGGDEDRGVLVLEDLGDAKLQDVLPLVAEAQRVDLYREAVADLLTLQQRAALVPPDVPCFRVAFDTEKLAWELNYFRQYFLEGWRESRLSPDDLANLEAAFADLAAEIARWPRVLCHRDYHSRNLMLHNGRLVWIDFQDARMGPATYDLVSLLRDPYVEIPEELVGQMAEEFRAQALPGESPEVFARRFDLMSLQRSLKALGTFGYQAVVRGNTVYVTYVPRALENARRVLRRYAELAPLHEVLSEQIQELQ